MSIRYHISNLNNMYRKTVQILILTFFLFFSINLVAQDIFRIELLITDTLIIKKKVKKSYKYAIKANAEITIPNLKDSVVLHSFNKYVSSHLFFAPSDLRPDSYKYFSTPLTYVIEDKEGKIKNAYFELVSYENPRVDIRIKKSRFFVTPKLKIDSRLLTEQEQRDYDLARYVISNEKQRLVLYPLLGKYHYLPKGEYYLYFVYSDYKLSVPPPEMRVEGVLDDDNVFRGYFVSNKVKLIIE